MIFIPWFELNFFPFGSETSTWLALNRINRSVTWLGVLPR